MPFLSQTFNFLLVGKLDKKDKEVAEMLACVIRFAGGVLALYHQGGRAGAKHSFALGGLLSLDLADLIGANPVATGEHRLHMKQAAAGDLVVPQGHRR